MPANRLTSLRASARLMAIGQAWGRVTTTRYSRMTWRLMRKGSGQRRARSKPALADSWCGASSIRAFTRMLVSTNIGQP